MLCPTADDRSLIVCGRLKRAAGLDIRYSFIIKDEADRDTSGFHKDRANSILALWL